jgi:hypothetical protein
MRGLAKSRRIQARAIAKVKSTQYAKRALLLITSLLANPQAWHAHVAAHDAKADPTHVKANIIPACNPPWAVGASLGSSYRTSLDGTFPPQTGAHRVQSRKATQFKLSH